MHIRRATKQDILSVTAFLTKANLGTDGLNETIEHFLLIESVDKGIQATLGLEPIGKEGLLRSLVISEGLGENDLFLLFEQMMMLAKEREFEALWLATNKQGASTFFEILGFTKVDSEEIPDSLLASEHIQHVLTVDNSLIMKISL